MRDMARWGGWIFWGLWGAALSSALGCLLGAPRTLQALAKDRILPQWLGQGFGKQNDPRMATAVSFGIALAGIWLGNFNDIATLLTMFFLTCYGLLNLSAALEGMINNPSWRPKFRVHWAFPLAGAAGCLVIMFMINSGATFIAVAITGGVYYVVKGRRLNAYWGDMRHGLLMMMIRYALYRLETLAVHAKTWRPNILVLSGSPDKRWYLIALADALSHGKGFLTVAVVLARTTTGIKRLDNIKKSIRGYLNDRGVPAIIKIIEAEDVFRGGRELVQSYGFGSVVPNTFLLGDMDAREPGAVKGYIELIFAIYHSRRNLVIVREDTARERLPHPQEALPIDLWFRGLGENSGLILALSYLLKTSPEWERSKLILKTIVENDDQLEAQRRRLEDFTNKENIAAQVEVIVNKNADPFSLMRESSRGAGFVFIGMKAPGADETLEQYTAYYQGLMNNARGFPALGMVLSSEEVDFDAIFQLRA
jgi:solute carrier family 12 (sodium/potassium/chloride transporter), member 2